MSFAEIFIVWTCWWPIGLDSGLIFLLYGESLIFVALLIFGLPVKLLSKQEIWFSVINEYLKWIYRS